MKAQRRALFLDRDGVINIDHGYVYRREQFEFVDGVFELCRKAVELKYLVFVVTNQAGIGRGHFTEKQFHELTDWMCQEFLARGAKIERVYFCPFHPEHGVGDYKQESIFRNPGPGMILEAARDYALDLAGSVLVGDQETDIAAGLAAGVGCNVLYGPRGNVRIPANAFVIDSLLEIVNCLAGGYRKNSSGG